MNGQKKSDIKFQFGQHLRCVCVYEMLRFVLFVLFFFFFFFFCFHAFLEARGYCSMNSDEQQPQMLTFPGEQCICVLFTDPQISFFINFFIKNGSHGTIYTFKNDFATVISAISFQFRQNKSYPNRPLVCVITYHINYINIAPHVTFRFLIFLFCIYFCNLT